jgi:hypothetical protein
MEPDNYDAMNDADEILSVLRQTGPSVPSESSTKVTNDPRAVCGHDAVLWIHHLSCRDSVLLGALYFVSRPSVPAKVQNLHLQIQARRPVS